MTYHYSKFSSLAFVGKPKQATVEGQWIVEYLSFCKPENLAKPPIVFLGGAFQTFFSFKKDVQVMMEDHPIFLLDLPSQGSNRQLSPDLKFEDYARILKSFFDDLGIAKITPIGLSYGSATAFYFASMYPERTERLILGGTTPRVRDSYRALLEDTFELLESGDMEVFSQGAVMNLINYSKREITKIPERVVKGFYKNMMSLSENDKLRYRHNTQRLLNLDGVQGTPHCQTLVLTGEYDNFTTPHENFAMSRLIPSSQFVLIEEGDHLANLEKRDVLINLYSAFLKGDSLVAVEGIKVMDDDKMVALERRLDTRLRPRILEATVIDASFKRFPCTIQDINTSGCRVLFSGDIWDQLDLSTHIAVELEEDRGLDLTAHVLRKEEIALRPPGGPTTLHCIFRRGNFEQGLRLENYVSSLMSELNASQVLG
jgi:pimeloyl-ACP methyl ester carboxylesterase